MFFPVDSKRFILKNYLNVLISEEHNEEEPEAEQSNQPTAKIGAKKQRKLEEKQARKAQREVGGHCHTTPGLVLHFILFSICK